MVGEPLDIIKCRQKPLWFLHATSKRTIAGGAQKTARCSFSVVQVVTVKTPSPRRASANPAQLFSAVYGDVVLIRMLECGEMFGALSCRPFQLAGTALA
jgi:hypothetical protein